MPQFLYKIEFLSDFHIIILKISVFISAIHLMQEMEKTSICLFSVSKFTHFTERLECLNIKISLELETNKKRC